MALSGFPAAARRALGDSQLRANLARATSTIRDKRGRVVAELPDWEELRASGSAIKDAALLGLADHLTQLESAVLAAGGHVHWAKDGDEACSIVAAVARSHGVDELVKVKSIATDEIGLNARLAADGILAVETDLAELIIQLDDDFPSHILVPAIHRNRAEIRDIFRRELGLEDLTDEPEALAEAARLHLRAKFLSARMGVSGANFAVAETGSVCVFESEGNGRMCTTLPEVLVTVMGVEKVVPSWRDMEVFLQLLPRSSTGERMNPYTSVWSGAGAPGTASLRTARASSTSCCSTTAACDARRRGRPPGAALHPLQRVPERVPGLRAGRRARVRLRVSGADRSDPDASARGHRGRRRLAPVRVVAVRGVRRGLPREDRDPATADPPARPRGGIPLAARPGEPHDEGPLPHLLVTGAIRASAEARPDGKPPAGAPARKRARPDDFPGPRPARGLDEIARAPRARTRDLPRMVAPHPRSPPPSPLARPLDLGLPHISRQNPERVDPAGSAADPAGGRGRPATPAPTSFSASVRPSATPRSPTYRATTAPRTNGHVTRS